jgi:hypothetical protein
MRLPQPAVKRDRYSTRLIAVFFPEDWSWSTASKTRTSDGAGFLHHGGTSSNRRDRLAGPEAHSSTHHSCVKVMHYRSNEWKQLSSGGVQCKCVSPSAHPGSFLLALILHARHCIAPKMLKSSVHKLLDALRLRSPHRKDS